MSDAFESLQISNDLDAKPEVPKPTGSPPAELVTDDVVVGAGAAAKTGDHVAVHYVGVSFSSGKQFDSSWDRGQPFDFPLGARRVIQGWDFGVTGMREGGRRTLVIPPSLGYGTRGAGGAIKPNETLVFIVDLVKVG
jgi:peptidylprolyl isomerase